MRLEAAQKIVSALKSGEFKQNQDGYLYNPANGGHCVNGVIASIYAKENGLDYAHCYLGDILRSTSFHNWIGVQNFHKTDLRVSIAIMNMREDAEVLKYNPHRLAKARAEGKSYQGKSFDEIAEWIQDTYVLPQLAQCSAEHQGSASQVSEAKEAVHG